MADEEDEEDEEDEGSSKKRSPVDMHFPDTYHRVKRALLSYCALEVILLAAWITGSHFIKFPATDVQLSIKLCSTVLWFVCAYYAWGYWNEVLLLRALNNKPTRKAEGVLAAMKAAQTKISEIAEALEAEARSFEVNGQAARIALSKAGLPGNSPGERSFFYDQATKITAIVWNAIEAQKATARAANPVELVMRGNNKIYEDLKAIVDGVVDATVPPFICQLENRTVVAQANAIEKAHEIMVANNKAIKVQAAAFDTYWSAISTHRHSNMLWELGGAGVLFGLATGGAGGILLLSLLPFC